jgi:hypothetical protein
MALHGLETVLYNMYPSTLFEVEAHFDEQRLGYVFWIRFKIKDYWHEEKVQFYLYEVNQSKVLLPEHVKAKLMLLLG